MSLPDAKKQKEERKETVIKEVMLRLK